MLIPVADLPPWPGLRRNPISGPPWYGIILHNLADDIRQALRRSRAVANRIAYLEGQALAGLREQQLYQVGGYVGYEDFCREALHVEPRTSRRRRILYEALRKHPPLEDSFLSGRLGISQVLALRPVMGGPDAAQWIGLAARSSFRELQREVRAAVQSRDGVAPPPDDSDESRSPISFRAPEHLGLAFEHGLEAARRVLGWEAPRDECLGALLSEAESALGNSTAEATSPADFAPSPVDPAPTLSVDTGRLPWTLSPRLPGKPRSVPRVSGYLYARRRLYRPKEVRWARSVLRRMERRLARLDTLVEEMRSGGALEGADASWPGHEGHPDRDDARVQEFLERWRTIQSLLRPFRSLEGQLLLALGGCGGLQILGYESLQDFLVTELQYSERSARQRVRETFLLLGWDHIHSRYLQGSIGVAPLSLLGPLAGEGEWLERARRVTCRQLAREIRFFYRVRRFDERLAWQHLPHDWKALEAALRLVLFRRGFEADALDRDLEARGLAGGTLDEETDPAECPVLLSRLEVLIDLVVLKACEEAAVQDDRLAARQTLSGPTKHVRIVIQARPEFRAHWERVSRRIRERAGPIPDWGVATLVLHAALVEWGAQNRERRPTEFHILERDGYRCQAPGCSARRQLEGHHLIFRSHQGCDERWNKITLCHGHHHYAVHAERLRVRGRAPNGLLWEIGRARGRAARWVYRGERLVAKGVGTGFQIMNPPYNVASLRAARLEVPQKRPARHPEPAREHVSQSRAVPVGEQAVG